MSYLPTTDASHVLVPPWLGNFTIISFSSQVTVPGEQKKHAGPSWGTEGKNHYDSMRRVLLSNRHQGKKSGERQRLFLESSQIGETSQTATRQHTNNSAFRQACLWLSDALQEEPWLRVNKHAHGSQVKNLDGRAEGGVDHDFVNNRRTKAISRGFSSLSEKPIHVFSFRPNSVPNSLLCDLWFMWKFWKNSMSQLTSTRVSLSCWCEFRGAAPREWVLVLWFTVLGMLSNLRHGGLAM